MRDRVYNSEQVCIDNNQTSHTFPVYCDDEKEDVSTKLIYI